MSTIKIFLTTEYSQHLEEMIHHLLPQLDPEKLLPTTEEIKEILANENTRFLTAQTPEGKVVGMTTLAMYRIPVGKQGWIEDVVVDSEHRGQGVGEALIRRALEEAKKAGVMAVKLTSNPKREAANRMYTRIGFEKRDTNVYRFAF